MHFIWPCSRLVRLLMPPIEAICWEFLGREAVLLFHHSIRAIVLGRKSTLSIQSPCVWKARGFYSYYCRVPFLQTLQNVLQVAVTSLFGGNNVNSAAAMLLLSLKYSKLIQSLRCWAKFNLLQIA